MTESTQRPWYQREKDSRMPAPESRDENMGSGLWQRCGVCGEISSQTEVVQQVCPRCGAHWKITAAERIRGILDSEPAPVEFDRELAPVDVLQFVDSKAYADRLVAGHRKTGRHDAFISLDGQLKGRRVLLGLFDFAFMGGSMGSVVGEKITRLFERGLAEKLPVIVVSSSGGARMQEGILSLMQMARTTAALRRLRAAGLPYISILAHPTTGGVAASFAMLGDLNIGEPGALIGFAGPRVIEQTIRQKLPEGFQRSKFLLEHGMLDQIVDRRELKDMLARVLGLLCNEITEPGPVPLPAPEAADETAEAAE